MPNLTGYSTSLLKTDTAWFAFKRMPEDDKSYNLPKMT